jgi:phosphoserine/homoserine phosphotransferase
MEAVCFDLEGVLVPEVWIEFARITGIEELRLTTRDLPDYQQLMQQRLRLLHAHELGLSDIQGVIAQMRPMPGARDLLDWLRERYQVFILSDTFYEFSGPLMAQLGWPTLFCNRLEVNAQGRVVDYHIRQKDQKRQVVRALAGLNYFTVAIGDSYNDTAMLAEADRGILFRPPQRVIDEFPQYPVVQEYTALRELICAATQRNLDGLRPTGRPSAY